MIKLKVSEAKKFANDKQWFKDYMAYICPMGQHNVADYETMKAAYEITNMNLSSLNMKMRLFCNPLGDLLADVEADQIDPLPDLKIKVDVLKGEALKRNEEFKLVLTTDQAIKAKNEEQMNLIQISIDEKVGLELFGLQKQMEGMSQEEAQKLIQDIRTKHEPEDIAHKDWQSDLEIFYSKILKNAYLKLNLMSLMADTIEDATIADRFYVYNGWRHGRPYIQIRNPLQGEGHKDPNQPFTHKGSYFWYRTPITIHDAIATYNISEADMDKLFIHSGLDKRHGLGGEPIPKDNMDFVMMFDNSTSNNKYTGLNQTSNVNSNRHDLVWETHLEFVAFKSVVFLSYMDEYNKPITEILSSDFEIPDYATKEKFINKFDQESERYIWFDKLTNTEFTAEEIWIPRLYEIIRLGNDFYPVCREVPYQPINPENPFDINLSTKGIILNARNSASLSYVQRAIPLYLQLLYLKSVQNRELAKYQGFIHSLDLDQIPDDLALDENGKKIRDKVAAYFAFLRKTNRDIYSGSQTSLGGLPPSTRSPGSSGFMLGTAIELMNLQSLIDMIKREISLAMGISPQREASFTQGSNVSDNQQAIVQSYTITEPLFYKHGLVWKEVLNDYLKAFRQFYQNQFEVFGNTEISEHFWLPDGSQETLSVTPKHISHSDIGLHLRSGSAGERYAEMMLNQAQAFAQNQGQGIAAVSQLIKDIVSGSSPEEIHKRILILEDQQFQRQQQLQQQQIDGQTQSVQMQIEAREDEQAHQLQLVRVKGEIEIAKEGIRATSLGLQQDLNNNNIPDSVDLANVYIKEQQLNLKEKELDHKIKNDEEKNKIARIKKTSK